MQEFTQQTFTEERALFHTIDARISDSVFDVGESPLKEWNMVHRQCEH